MPKNKKENWVEVLISLGLLNGFILKTTFYYEMHKFKIFKQFANFKLLEFDRSMSFLVDFTVL